MNAPKWLLPEVIIAVHKMLIAERGGLPGVKELSLLESALSRPQQLIAYGDNYEIPALAAAYCFGLARNHPFVDSDKRIALTAAGMFLELNEYSLKASEADAVVVIEGLAAGEIEEPDLSAWFLEKAVHV